MAVFTLGEAASIAAGLARPGNYRNGGLHRTGAPVHRGSLEAGSFEDAFFSVPGKGEPDRLLQAVKAFAAAGKKRTRDARAAGHPLSAADRLASTLTLSAVDVMEHLLTYWRVCKGAVFPTYDKLAAITGLGRATVARAIHQLAATGFLIRQRRFVSIDAEGPGPRRRQTSNAYRPVFAQVAERLLPRWMRAAPVPDDMLQREAERLQDTATMLAGLNNRDYAQAAVGGELGAMLARLGAALDNHRSRESQNELPPLTQSNMITTKRVGLAGQRPKPNGSSLTHQP